MRKREKGSGSVYLRGRVWWIAYEGPEGCFKESTRTTIKEEAKNLLRFRLHALRNGLADTRSTTIGELMLAVLRDYRVNGKRSEADAESRWRVHLEPVFAQLPAARLTSLMLEEYMQRRLDQGAKPATINREFALLKRAFSLGLAATPPRVTSTPKFPHLRENNVRVGFLADSQYEALAAACAKRSLEVRTIFECGYQLGWRVSEILSLRVGNVDLVDNAIRLEPGTTKNGEGREVFMPLRLSLLMRQCARGKESHHPLFGIKDFRGAWEAARKEAGVPNLLFHDLRRTAVRNMVRRGIPEHTAMKITGHRTRSVFDRYHIVDQQDLKSAAARMTADFGEVGARANKGLQRYGTDTVQSKTVSKLSN